MQNTIFHRLVDTKERDNMENVAYSQDYSRYRQEKTVVFHARNMLREETIMLSSGYQLKRQYYQGEVGNYTLYATENTLLDKSAAVVYRWQNLYNTGEFCKIIEHSNGNQYMIFRSDLYGYSVLDLATLQDFHYYPSGSFPTGETFIWTDVFYNETNNVLAVSGCYWACPFGILLVEFSNPMKEPGVWADVQEHLTDGYDKYDDMDFMEWRGSDLILSAYNNQTGTKEVIIFSEDQYIKAFR